RTSPGSREDSRLPRWNNGTPQPEAYLLRPFRKVRSSWMPMSGQWSVVSGQKFEGVIQSEGGDPHALSSAGKPSEGSFGFEARGEDSQVTNHCLIRIGLDLPTLIDFGL